jgi:4-diphosphocytidyl-2-C-methyl-D-erythritol kinase
MMNFVEPCPAKLNLCLHVGASRSDGYHDLRSVVVPTDWSDRVEVSVLPGTGLVSLTVVPGPDDVPTGPDNLAFRAARAFLDETAAALDLSVRLSKTIPAGAGLGGGSSDAAGVLRALNSAMDQPLPSVRLREIAAGLGSDCTFFMDPMPSIMTGRGEIIEPLRGFSALDVVVVVPVQRLSTAEMFRDFDVAGQGQRLTPEGESDIHPCPLERGSGTSVGCMSPEWFRNDLAPVVFRRCPRSLDRLEALSRAGARGVAVTGAGSAVFGVFVDTARARRAEAILRQDALPGEVVRVVRTGA